MSISCDLISGAFYLPILVELVVGGALTAAGIYVVPHPDLHTHFAVIDQEIVWYGNTNLLSRDKEDDGLMRIGSRDVALELLEEIGR